MGKHLGMMERNDQGKSIRDYFIAKEAEAFKSSGQAVEPPERAWSKDRIEAAAAFIRNAAQDLRLAQSSVLGMYQKLEVKAELSGMLLGYAVDAPTTSVSGSSEATKSLSELLPQFGISLSAVFVNRLLLQKGFLEENERASTHGTKKFKTVANLKFGKNLTSPNNPRETQPHWYISKFAELMSLVLPTPASICADASRSLN